MPKYTIEARSLNVLGVAGHDFWVLRDEQGKALAELHGLATDRQTGEALTIGTDEARHSFVLGTLRSMVPMQPQLAPT